jgi:hypothetical protein
MHTNFLYGNVRRREASIFTLQAKFSVYVKIIEERHPKRARSKKRAKDNSMAFKFVKEKYRRDSSDK